MYTYAYMVYVSVKPNSHNDLLMSLLTISIGWVSRKSTFEVKLIFLI